jgi:hypothetical protein
LPSKICEFLDNQLMSSLCPLVAASVDLLSVFSGLEIADMQIDICSILSPRSNGWPGYRVVRVTEVESLVAA